MLVREVMTSPAVTVEPGVAARDALRLLDAHQITALPVVDGQGRLVGIVSEADLLEDTLVTDPRRHMMPVNVSASPPPQRVGEVMTRYILTVAPDSDLRDAVHLMSSTMVKSLPVVETGKVVGVVSRRDIVHVLAREDERIRGDIDELLRSDELDWLVEVRSGLVEISGPRDEHERRLVEVLATSVPGVSAVHIRAGDQAAG